MNTPQRTFNPLLAGFAFMALVFAMSRFVVPSSQPIAAAPTQLTEYAILGHPAEALYYSPNRQLVAQVQNGAVQLYSADFEPRTRIEVVTGGNDSLVWSPDGQFITIFASATNSWTVWAISADGNNAEHVVDIPNYGRLSWKPDSSQLATGGHVYDLQTGVEVFRHYGRRLHATWPKGGTEVVSSQVRTGERIHWSHDGRRFVAPFIYRAVSSSRNYGVFAADKDSLDFLLVESDIDTLTLDFVWSPDDRFISNGFTVWDSTTGAQLYTISYERLSILEEYKVLWSPDSNYLYRLTRRASFSRDINNLRAWDVQTGEVLFDQDFYTPITNVYFDGADLIAETQDRRQIVLNTDTGTISTTQEMPPSFVTYDIAWDNEGTRLVAAGIGSSTVPLWLWDVTRVQSGEFAEPIWVANADLLSISNDIAHYGVSGVRLWFHNDFIFTETTGIGLSQFATIRQWSAADGSLQNQLYWVEDKRFSVNASLSPDQQSYVLNYHSPDPGQVDIVSAETGIKRYSLPSGENTRGIWSPDSERIVTISYSETPIRIWNVATGAPELLTTLSIDGDEAAWSPDSQMIAITSAGWWWIADASSGTILASEARFIRTVTYISPLVTWSPDNRHIAVAWEGELQIMDVLTDSVVFSTVPRLPIRQLAWSPTGETIASVYRDGTIGLWRVE